MATEQKLTKEIVFDALGKKSTSPEFKAIIGILGEPKIEMDADIDRVDYTWDNYGINIVMSYDTEIFENIFFYPNGTKTDKEYLTDRESCKAICKENDFDQNLTMHEVREKYGSPDREQKTHGGYELIYYNIDNLERYYTFSNENELYSIMIGQRDL